MATQRRLWVEWTERWGFDTLNEESSANDPSREGVAIFMAEGVVCERLGVPIDAAIVVLADMAVTRGLSLLDMAEAILGGATVPAPTPRPASPRRERPAAGSD